MSLQNFSGHEMPGLEIGSNLEVWTQSVKSSTVMCLNPLSPNSDQYQISPCNINAYSTPEVMAIKDMIIQGEFS